MRMIVLKRKSMNGEFRSRQLTTIKTPLLIQGFNSRFHVQDFVEHENFNARPKRL